MSVVIAVKDKNTGAVTVGCDSQVSCGNLKNKLNGDSCKIWRYNGISTIIIGGVGFLRDIQLVQTCHDLIDELDILKMKVDYEYCVTKLFTRIYKLMTDYNRVTISKEGVPSANIESKFLIAFADKAFIIDNDGAVTEIADYLVLGSGEEVASGVLENNKNKAPKTRIIEAIEACAERTLFVNKDITVLSTIDGFSKQQLKALKGEYEKDLQQISKR